MTRLKHYSQLVLFRAYAELRAESTRTYLGVLWWIFDPILFMAVFYVVFAVLLESRTGDFISFLLTGLVVWRFFASTINGCAMSISGAVGLMQQVYVHKAVFPIIVFISNLFKYGIVFALLIIFLWARGYTPDGGHIALIPLTLVLLAFSLSLGLLVSAVVPLLPDLRHVVSHVVQMAFFLSGIFFSSADVPEDKRDFFYMNPMTVIIELHRDVLLNGEAPDFWRLLPTLLITGLVFVVSLLLIHRFDRRYPIIVRVRG